MNCLLHSILPKADTQTLFGTTNPWLAYGLPETLVVDHGPEFVGRDLEDACAQLGIMIDTMPVCRPWFKGSIERSFRTTNTGLIHTLPGTTFSNVVERGEYDSVRHACISLATFWRLLHIFLLDVYAQRWHAGVEGIPARRWAANVDAGVVPTLPRSAADVRLLLFPSAERTLQRTGVAFESVMYQSADLAALRLRLPATQRRVRLKIDPADIGCIYVLDPTARQDWLAVPATNQAYAAGLSLWKHRRIRRYVLHEREHVDVPALAAAKGQIQTLVEREFRLTRQSRTRKAAARLLEIGTGPAPSTGMFMDERPSSYDDHSSSAPVASPETAAIAAHPPIPNEPPSLPGFGGDWDLSVPDARSGGR